MALTDSHKKAFWYSKKACDLGEIVGCYNLGVFYAGGIGVDKDENLAIKHYKNGV